MVGCVIVKDDTIISEGFHQCCGENHAERNAILRIDDKSALKGSTLYVNLEPCSHYGKTPPCADLISQYAFERVVVCNLDPNPLVSGRGIEKISKAGIKVTTGVLEKEGRLLNRRFFTFMEKRRPFVILKWAQTRDGFMDIDRNDDSQKTYWITNQKLKCEVHKWRTQEAAIMVGTQTVVNDDPQLTARLWHGNNPVRVAIDRNGRIPSTAYILDGSCPTIIYTENSEMKCSENLQYVVVNFDNLLDEILTDLWNRKIQSIIVEGGLRLLNTFIEQQLWDEARVLIGNKMFGKGLNAPTLHTPPTTTKQVDDDFVCLYYNQPQNHYLCSTIHTKP
jgi:diaminohydroxyphosphoribosylaminopyrimidine deaminase/5-amino-6-(5-phosphoribosylamino)uracil reductase